MACWELQGSGTMGLGAIDDINENLDKLLRLEAIGKLQLEMGMVHEMCKKKSIKD
jgi:hypothetical protein